MPMQISGRHDGLLLAGFAFALLVVFERSFQYLLEVAREVEATYGVALIPALFILSGLFVFQQYSKRQEMKSEAMAAAAEATQARQRTGELEGLVTLGQAVGRALTLDALREALWRQLPGLITGREVWILVRTGSRWQRLIDPGHVRDGEIEDTADAVIAQDDAERSRPEGCARPGHVCFPMIVGREIVGMLGVAASPECSPATRRMIGASAAMLAIAVRNVQLFAQLRDNSLRDALTDCFNRHHGLEVLDAEMRRARRSELPLSILMFDVDGFKEINDRHGHLSGDAVLAAIGQRMRQILRRSDVRCRYGGDEFLVVLPETSPKAASKVAEWLRQELQELRIQVAGQGVSPTVSIGVATAVEGDADAEAFISRADAALYEAKRAGRNCVREQGGARQRWPAPLSLPRGPVALPN
jgi:diguanylate cyclase (GGDEF)-like protein